MNCMSLYPVSAMPIHQHLPTDVSPHNNNTTSMELSRATPRGGDEVEELCSHLKSYLITPSDSSTAHPRPALSTQSSYENHIYENIPVQPQKLFHQQHLPARMSVYESVHFPLQVHPMAPRPQSLCVPPTSPSVGGCNSPMFHQHASEEGIYDNLPGQSSPTTKQPGPPVKRYFASGSPLIDPKYHGSPVTRLDAKVLSGDTTVFTFNPVPGRSQNNKGNKSKSGVSALADLPISFVKTRRGDVVKVVGHQIQSQQQTAQVPGYSSNSYRPLSQPIFPSAEATPPPSGWGAGPLRSSGRYQPLPPHPLQLSQQHGQQQQGPVPPSTSNSSGAAAAGVRRSLGLPTLRQQLPEHVFHHRLSSIPSSPQSDGPPTSHHSPMIPPQSNPSGPPVGLLTTKPPMAPVNSGEWQQRFHMSQRYQRPAPMDMESGERPVGGSARFAYRTQSHYFDNSWDSPMMQMSASRLTPIPPSTRPEIAHTPWGPTPNVAVALDPTYRPQSMVHLPSGYSACSPILPQNATPVERPPHVVSEHPLPQMHHQSVLSLGSQSGYLGVVMPPTGRLVHSQSQAHVATRERKSSTTSSKKIKGLNTNCGVQ